MSSAHGIKCCGKLILLIVVCSFSVYEQDARLSEIRDLLVPMRIEQKELLPSRGATPQFTRVKHLLRDWVESRLSGLAPTAQPNGLQAQLNAELKKAGLICEYDANGTSEVPCPELGGAGFLGGIRLTEQNEILIVITGLSVQNCGFDESAYAYKWSDNAWQRFWKSEQDDYTADKYNPQEIVNVLISPRAAGGTNETSKRLVLTLGQNPWCTSSWQPIYYRVWRVGGQYSAPKLLLQNSVIAFLTDPPFSGEVKPNEVQVEYPIHDVGTGIRTAIQHLSFEQDRVRRIEPYALSTNDFVDEWLQQPWSISSVLSRFSEARSWHEKLNADLKSGRYMDPRLPNPTAGCQTPGFWQESYRLSDSKKDMDEWEQIHFLVSWSPPYHFSLMGISNKPWPGCNQEKR